MRWGSRSAAMSEAPEAHITVRNLDMAYGSFVIQRDLNFTIRRGDIFIIMGGSGCGKSTLLKHLVGLMAPARGDVFFGQQNFWLAAPAEQERLMRRFGILYQSGALWSSMSLADNVGLPLGEFTDLKAPEIRRVASLKLALVGLAGFEDFFPSEISGGMRKRAGLARAMALDPEILFFDADTKTMIAQGDPKALRDHCPDPKVRNFLLRGELKSDAKPPADGTAAG